MTDTIDVAALVERLRADAAQLRKMQENARFGGDHTHVRVANPEFLLGDLTEAANALATMREALEEWRAAHYSMISDIDTTGEVSEATEKRLTAAEDGLLNILGGSNAE